MARAMNRWAAAWLCFGLVLTLGPVALCADEGPTIVVDGITVPDIGPLPAYVPTPPTNLGYAQKVELGRQLYFDTRLSKNNSV